MQPATTQVSEPPSGAAPTRVRPLGEDGAGAGRIAIFLPDLRGGGAERVMLNIARALSDLGCSVDMVLANKQGEYVDLVPKAIRVVDLGVARSIASVPPLVQYLRTERPAALISAPSHLNGVAVMARALSGTQTRVIITIHNTMSVESDGKAGLKQRLVPLVTRRIAPMADAIVAVSAGVADDLARFVGISRDRIAVIYNPVVSPEVIARSNEPIDHPWFAAGEPPVILGVGRLNAQKDFGNLIEAFSEVRRHRNARLLILGQGEERASLEERISKLGLASDVALPGFAANPYAYMRHASVFALSSRFEGLPTVLIEALACGCRVVSTDCPSGPREILENISAGALVPVGDPAGLAQALMVALDAPRPNLPQETWNRYTLKAAAESYLDLITEVIGGRIAKGRGSHA